MTDTPEKDLRQRLEEIDDAFTVRALAVLDVADELYRRNSERIAQNTVAIERLGLQIDRNALALDRLASRFDAFVTQAEADRAIMLQLLRQLATGSPNGKGKDDSPS